MGSNKDLNKNEKNFTEKLSAFIVDKRKAFYLIYIGLIIFSLISSGLSPERYLDKTGADHNGGGIHHLRNRRYNDREHFL